MNQPSRRQPFNVRAFVSVGMLCAGLGLPWTGWANHLLQGEGMTVARHAWMTAHNSLGVLFALFGAWHVALNRRALANYIRGAFARVAVPRREVLCAAALVTVMTALAVSHAFHVR
jgi:hypothetical protein